MPGDTRLHHLTSSGWVRRAAAPPPDVFTLGVTQPTRENTGLIAGRSRVNDATTTITSVPADKTVRDRNFSNLVSCNLPEVVWENCNFTGSYAGDDTPGLLTIDGNAVANHTITRCHFKPTSPGDRQVGVRGHHFRASRNTVEHVVDGFAVVNLHGPRADTYVEGNYVDALAWFADDRPAAPNGHSDGTHNDGVVLHAGLGLWVVGNTLRLYRHNVLGTASTRTQAGCGVLVELNGSNTLAVGDVHVNQNFVYGGEQVFFFRADKPNGTYAGYAVEALGNTWMDDDQVDFGGSLKFYNLRIHEEITLNGRTYPTTGGTVDEFGNRYSATSVLVDPTRRGNAVLVRADATAG